MPSGTLARGSLRIDALVEQVAPTVSGRAKNNLFQLLEPLGARRQQLVPTFTRAGAVGRPFFTGSHVFEQNQLKNCSKLLKIAQHRLFSPISEGLGGT